jgi:raffinose/stachyose/melibiose transport system substrate-binding protein
VKRRQHGIGIAITAISVAAITAGCANIGSSNGPDAQGSSQAKVVTGAKACTQYGNDVTLTVGVSETGQAIAEQDKNLASQFEARNPGVKINLQVKDFADSLATIKLAMSGDNPPDVMEGNEGWSIDGALWQAGLIKNLTAYGQAYGWYDKFPQSALTVNEFTADGKTFGKGELTGLPQAIQYVGVFYNKSLLKQIGVTDPSTLDDKTKFLAAIAQAKSRGITPVMLGDSEKNWALHNLSLFNGWYLTPAQINAWVFNTAGTTYDNAGNVQGAKDLQDWMKKGYFNSDALATSFDDAEARFGKNQAAFFITGTWALGDLQQKMGGNVGFMLWPAGASGKHAAVGGYSLPFTISAKTKYPDCAASFLNFVTTSPQASTAQIASGRPSATIAGLDAKVSNPLLAQMVSEYKRLNADNGLFTWEDWPTPTMLTFSGSQAQLLLDGHLTPQQFTTAIQKNWSDYMSTKP